MMICTCMETYLISTAFGTVISFYPFQWVMPTLHHIDVVQMTLWHTNSRLITYSNVEASLEHCR